MKRRIISVLLVLALIFGCMPTVFAVSNSDSESTAVKGAGPVSLSVGPGQSSQESSLAPAESEGEKEPEGTQTGNGGLPKFESGQAPFSENDAATVYAADDIVTFIVVTERKPLLSVYSVGDISAQTADVQSYERDQQTEIDSVQSRVEQLLGKQEGFRMGYTYTIATTGFSVTTAYGNKQTIAGLDGVSKVYVAPTYALPESGTEGAVPYTNNASTMIGANVLNASGFTGKGMRIAILDTGIKVDHPSFAPLSDEQLSDPLTREYVEGIWKTLNAGKSTSKLNLSYESTKIPFVFNYVAHDFNVANTYAGSDHGTHVAGIAAGNKLSSTSVVGVAPEAQLLAMQVFSPSGGASWDVIIAALEDCVRLDVDSVNLSLGAAAGFTDSEGEMLEVMELFKASDIQVLIASGNDTNNAYGNAHGYNQSLLANPDTGLAGTPSTYSAALSVASMENDGFTQLYFTVNGKDMGYQDTATTSDTMFIANFRNQELQFVMVPGYGEPSDYEGLDVEGKVAVVSRGSTSFPDKQAAAQEAGAIACIIYNNAMGVINMQINDGAGNIPCISVSMASGAYMMEQAAAGSNTLKVCNADTKLFKIERMVSDFSSWGVTPDLKLKPEISGVGGNIYSSVDPAISGSDYGTMSGTSMATPQITGAMAVLKQYLMEKYPSYTGAALRQLAANLMMSTAIPAFATSELEYSPRAQGAGLADLVQATTSPAYLSNPAASEGRPKVEFGDDPAKAGVYSFSFVINNLTADTLTYDITSSVMTEAISNGIFIANAPYGLEARVEVAGGNQVTVPGSGSVTVNATLTLTQNDKAYLAKFPNGIYVEGYVYATPVTSEEAEAPVKLVLPMVGFYGDWSAAPIFDETDSYSLYPLSIYTNFAEVGTNPYIRTGRSGNKYNAFSYSNPLAEVDVGLLRNIKTLNISAANKETGEVYFNIEGYDIAKSFYSASYGMVIPFYVLTEEGELWNGTDQNGNKLPEGTTATVKFEAWLDDGDSTMDDAFSFDITLDSTAPQLVNANDLQSHVRYENGHVYLTLDLLENQYLAAVLFESSNGDIMSKAEVENEPGVTGSFEFDITGYGEEFSIILGDYACNETIVEVDLDLSGAEEETPEVQPLDKERIYGSETYSQAAVEPGWFSANKTDLTNTRNETFDSNKIYYAAEYVNGYLIGQNAGSGNLELITPAGSYWGTKTIVSQNGQEAGDPGSWVMYDMALDYSGQYKELLDPYNYVMNGEDALFAIGWKYAGDTNNDGHDDGSNVLWQVCLYPNGYVDIDEIGQIVGVEAGYELLTLGITTEGDMYGIGTDGVLYALSIEYEDYGYKQITGVKATAVGSTGFSAKSGGNPNVIQSMGYDHNTGTMYWFAHTQKAAGSYYNHYNMTYKVNLETGALTEVGTYGAGGQTALFIPNDLQSDLFELGADPTRFSIGEWSITMVEGQEKKLTATWEPWNATPGTLTWASEDESVATVDQKGNITAIAEGETVISATGEIWNEYRYDENWNPLEPGWDESTQTCKVRVVKAQDEIYAYIISDYNNVDNQTSWVTYADTTPKNVTKLSDGTVTYVDGLTGETVTTEALWQGGAYYNGYVYTVMAQSRAAEDGTFGAATVLYRSRVTRGATPAETLIGEPEEIGYTMGVEVGNLGFDYNTGRMYGVDLTTGGLAIVDLDTGSVDSLGAFTGDIGGAAIATAMCVTADGTIIIADMASTIYTVDPDTMNTRQIASGGFDSWYYGGMTYDYNTGNIYWNPCHNADQSPFYMILRGINEWGDPETTLIDMGDVSTNAGVEQCVIFTIPENEPETTHIPVESITINQGDSIVGLEGGYTQLTTVTEPLRPSVQTRIWTSSNEDVVTVDRNGNLEYVGVGTATITVSITNKDEATYGGPFTDSIEVTVLEAAGEFQAFLAEDAGGTSWYDFWLSMNDYDLRHATPGESAISIYSLRAGTYFDGYYYGYDTVGRFYRIDAENPMSYKILGSNGLDYDLDQVTSMAFDYTTGTMYGLTLRSNYSYVNWGSMRQTGKLVTIDLATGELTTVAELDFDTPVYTMAADGNGTLYAVGSNSASEGTAHLYTVNKQTGELTLMADLPGVNVYTGPSYYGPSYNAQMTYEYSLNRLYLNATTSESYGNRGFSSGVILIQLGQDTPTVANLGGISIYARTGATLKKGSVFMGLMEFIPEEEQLPACPVVGITTSKESCIVAVGGTTTIDARVQPMNVADPTLLWVSANPSIATVDENGTITGVSVGTTTVTVTSRQDPTRQVEITVSVIDRSGAQSVAYTISENRKALLSFDPEMPGQTEQVICSMDGIANIKGLTMGDGFLYYLVEAGWSYELYRLDLLTNLSLYMGTLENFGDLDDIAYDRENNILYAVGGFYLFEYNMDKENASDPNYYSNYLMDQDYVSLAAVAVVDGAIYTAGTGYYDNGVKLIRYSDKYLNDRLVVNESLTVNVVKDASEMDYDSRTGKFYVTDAGHKIYEMDLQGNARFVDFLGEGTDLHGLAIDATPRYRITYTDGVEDEEVFADQILMAEAGKATPAFVGTPAREGYTFAAWTPEPAEVVEGHATYTATWTANVYKLELDPAGGQVDPDTVTVFFDQAVGTLPVPTKEGHTFTGWVNEAGDLITAETIYRYAGNSKLTATWSGDAYTITLDPAGGAVDLTSVEVVYGEAVNTLPVPTRVGYTFAGWYHGDECYTAETIYTVVGNITLTASWTGNTYSVELDPGEGAEVEPDTLPVTYGEPVGALPVPTREGYTFAGWVDAEGNPVTAETVYETAGDLKLTATWTASTYTITLDAGEGTVEPAAITVTYGEAIGTLPAATREGYKFTGWVDAEGNPVTEKTVYETAADGIFTATWIRDAANAETGDRMPVELLLTVMVLSAAAAVSLILLRKKEII